MMIALTAVLAIVGVWTLLLVAFARRLHADWREPVLSTPVLIVESDDWGPGPVQDAGRLEELALLLQESRDGRGHAPLVTLGVVLAAPGAPGPDAGGPRYAPRLLDEPEFEPIRRAMRAGVEARVFALQLHGMEHFWPPALERAAQCNPSVRAFLDPGQGVPRHESLPPHLQARWIDASQLPSRALDPADIERAVAGETACFARVFGAPAAVAVPVTFTWTTAVEAAWARHGVRVIVTPGMRNIGRDVHGQLIGDGSLLRNGDPVADGIVLVVRDIYFEPALGHTAERVLPQICEHFRLGRPALLEMHRFNFTGAAADARTSQSELRRLLQGVLASRPDLRFMSTEALAEALRTRDPAFVERRLAARVRSFVLRAATDYRLRKLAWTCGLALAAGAMLTIASALLRSSTAHGRIRR